MYRMLDGMVKHYTKRPFLDYGMLTCSLFGAYLPACIMLLLMWACPHVFMCRGS